MNPLGGLGKLFKSEESPAPTQQEWPDEGTPGYYEDDSLTNIGDANSGETEVQWDGPTSDYSIPYRGAELHGVPTTTHHYEVIPSRIVPAKSDTDTVPQTVTVPELDPIPVRVIETPTPLYMEKYIATAQYQVSNAGPNVRIVSKSDRRFRTRISSLNGTVLIGAHDNSSLASVGFLLPANQFLEVDVTQPIYAIGNNAAVDTVYVIQEISREYDENEINSL